jgi:hypothetical protein
MPLSTRSMVKPIIWSLLAGLALVGTVGTISSYATWTGLGVLLLPGILLAAMALPEGIHSSFAVLYFLLAALTNVLLYSIVPWMYFSRHYARRSD